MTSRESRLPAFKGLLIGATVILFTSTCGFALRTEVGTERQGVPEMDTTRIRDSTSRIPAPHTVSSPRQKAVLARIDSLWEAGAGLTFHEELRSHIERVRAGADSLFLLNLLFREGRVLAALDRPLDAEPVLREGMLLADTLQEPLLYRACLRWLGVALIGRGRLNEVAASFERLLELSRESGDAYHEGYAWMGLAYCDWRNGTAAAAREKYERSADIFRELGHPRGELWALTGLNNALTSLGAYGEAIAGNRRIVAMGRENNWWEVEAHGYNNLGVLLYSLGDNGEALLHFQRAAELQEENGYIREAIIAGGNVCQCEIALGRTRDASRRLRDLLETSRENGYIDVQAGLLNKLASAHVQQGDFHLAARLFRETLGLPDGLTPKHECEAVIGLSGAMAGMDSTRAALELLRSEAAVMLALEDARSQFAFRSEMAERLLDENLPDEAYETAMVVEDRGAELGLTRYRLEALPLAARAARALGEPDSAMALLRRGVRLWERDRGLPLDPEWREQRGAAARELFTQLAWSIVHNSTDRTREERIREAFDVLQAYKARTLLERMLGPGGGEVPVLESSPVTLAELQTRVLAPGELLLEYVVGSRHSLLFACTSGEIRAAALPGGVDLNRRVQLFHELLAVRPSEPQSPDDLEAMTRTGRNMADLLFSSCTDLIARSRHVIVVPDGALNLVPFSYLLGINGMYQSGGRAAGWQPEIPPAAVTVNRVPAATILAWLREEGGGTSGMPRSVGRILALSGRVTDSGDILHGAKREVALLTRRYVGVTTRLRRADDFSGFDILHFAAHSSVNDQFPWRSAINLNADTGRTVLRASEIAGWKLSAGLVVLSSCESAGGRIISGEGVQGLSSAFLSAGVPSVLATLWPVDDRVTVEFIAAFYEALHGGENVSVSLRKAQEMFRRSSGYAHPFYWAGFALIGEGALRVKLKESPWRRLTPWAVAILAAAVVWVALAAFWKKMYGTQ